MCGLYMQQVGFRALLSPRTTEPCAGWQVVARNPITSVWQARMIDGTASGATGSLYLTTCVECVCPKRRLVGWR